VDKYKNVNKRYQLLKKINHALLCISLTQCNMDKPEVESDLKIREVGQSAKVEKTKRLYQFHYVQKGERLSQVAKRYGMTEENLLHLNQMKYAKKVHPGQRLHVHKHKFDEFKSIPIVEANQLAMFTDYAVDKKRTEDSLEYAEKHKERNVKFKEGLLAPIAAVGAVGAGAGKFFYDMFDKKPAINLPTNLPMADMGAAVGGGDTNIVKKGVDVIKDNAGLIAGGGALGLGLLGMKTLLDRDNDNRVRIEKELYQGEACVRMAMGWPLCYKTRDFTYVNPQFKEAGIFIKNTQRELFVVPAFPGQIIDIKKPNKKEDRYTITIKHKCNNLVTVYGNLRIPSEGNILPENLIGVYVSRTDPIGLIDPDVELFFAVKQLQAGKDANSVNYEFQQIAKKTARLMRESQINGDKIDIGGFSFGVEVGRNRSHKTLLFNNKAVTEVYFRDPMVYLPKASLPQI